MSVTKLFESTEECCREALDIAREIDLSHVLIICTTPEGEVSYVEAGSTSLASTIGRIEIIKSALLSPEYEEVDFH